MFGLYNNLIKPIYMKKTSVFLGLIASFAGLLLAGTAFGATGSNLVSVTNCNQVSNGVSITRFGKTYTLPNGIREAGHGLRNYALTCVGNKQYKVQWTDATDSVKPTGTLTLLNKTFNSTQTYNAQMRVTGSDTNSPITQVKVYISGSGYTGWYNIYSWTEITSAKQITKDFTINNLNYSTTYNLYAQIFDATGNSQTVSLNGLTQNSIVQDADYPNTVLSVQNKNLKTNNFDVNMQVSANDNTSAVTKLYVYVNGLGYSGWTKIFTWEDTNATAKNVTKNFTLNNLSYNNFYNFYVQAFDSTGKEGYSQLNNVSSAALMPMCATFISGYGYYTMCPNQTVTYNSNLKFTNIYAVNSLLVVKVNDTSYISFNLGEEKIVEGNSGVKVKVKFNSLDQQQNASIIISQV